MTRRAAVAAPNALAAQAGLDLIHLGGNAVDAAIAAMLTTYVSEPGIVSALGAAYVNIWPRGGYPIVIDGNAEMPGRGLPPERFHHGLRKLNLDYGGGITIYAGAGSAAIPGSFAALHLANERFGRAPWAELVGPAIEVARSGFRMGAAAASYLQIVGDSLYGFDPQTRAAHFRDGHPLTAGTLITSPELADSLELIATEGVSALYGGELGEALVRHMADNGGIISMDDLRDYQAVLRPATMDRLGDWLIATNPPPSIGGPVLATMCRLLHRRGHTAADVLRIQVEVLRYRADHLDVADDLEAAGADLLRSLENNDLTSLPTSSDTAHVSVIDTDGLTVAMTSSAGYSSGVTVPGTGMVLNNCLGEPELNRHGFHALAPGTRLASNMAPTTAHRTDGTVLAIGTPGADRITTALMQVLARHLQDELDIQHAIDAPRMHVHWTADGRAEVDAEPDPALAQAISDAGYPLVAHQEHAMYFGGVAAARMSANGALSAAADPRRASATAVD